MPAAYLGGETTFRTMKRDDSIDQDISRRLPHLIDPVNFGTQISLPDNPSEAILTAMRKANEAHEIDRMAVVAIRSTLTLITTRMSLFAPYADHHQNNPTD
jgi:hypothetical protein